VCSVFGRGTSVEGREPQASTTPSSSGAREARAATLVQGGMNMDMEYPEAPGRCNPPNFLGHVGRRVTDANNFPRGRTKTRVTRCHRCTGNRCNQVAAARVVRSGAMRSVIHGANRSGFCHGMLK